MPVAVLELTETEMVAVHWRLSGFGRWVSALASSLAKGSRGQETSSPSPSLFPILASVLLLFASPPAWGQAEEVVELTPAQVQSIFRNNRDLIIQLLFENSETLAEVLDAASARSQDITRRREEIRSRLQTFTPGDQPLIDTGRPIRGSPRAAVTIVEYGDFQCPHCRRVRHVVSYILRMYGGRVRFVYKHMPLDSHSHALTAARYYEAISAIDHSAAWRFHDVVFRDQPRLRAEGAAFLDEIAADLGIDADLLSEELSDEATVVQIISDIEEAQRFQLRPATPSFLINGFPVTGAVPAGVMIEVIDFFLQRSSN